MRPGRSATGTGSGSSGAVRARASGLRRARGGRCTDGDLSAGGPDPQRQGRRGQAFATTKSSSPRAGPGRNRPRSAACNRTASRCTSGRTARVALVPGWPSGSTTSIGCTRTSRPPGSTFGSGRPPSPGGTGDERRRPRRPSHPIQHAHRPAGRRRPAVRGVIGRVDPWEIRDPTTTVVRAAGGNSAIELKGATVPYTSVNGHMFSFRTSAGMALGLPTEARDAFLETYDTRLCEQHGHEGVRRSTPALLERTTERSPTSA